MGRSALLATIALIALCIGGTTIDGCTTRKTQVYLPDTFYMTAQSLYAYVYTNNSLYSVNMYYDNVYDVFINQGVCGIWNPPLIAPFDFVYWNSFVKPDSALGIMGPLGPTGPLSPLGPAGSNTWNPSNLITGQNCSFCTALYQWIFSEYSDATNPLGYNGVLGYSGPLTTNSIYAVLPHLGTISGTTPFSHNLDIPGVWGALGPLSHLGPLGLLGPLGPIGATGFSTVNPATNMTDGIYRNRTDGQIQRSVLVPFNALKTLYRVYDLYELYPMKTAQTLPYENDCTFAVDGSVRSPTDAPEFTFASSHSQLVSVLIMPSITNATLSFSTFSIEVDQLAHDSTYSIIGSSALPTNQQINAFASQTGYINWVVFRAHPGQKLRATVRVLDYLTANPNFRLLVTGTGFNQGATPTTCVDADLFNHLDITGPYQRAY